ncbi:MAG: hypothetical protein WC829_23260 [Hyphomicrobium sp.]|jgi:hypothetical protein
MSENGYDAETIATGFDQMAAQIRLNKAGNFGGAFVLVPPVGMGQPVQGLILNSSNAAMMFWANLKIIVDDTLIQLKEQQRLQGR